jgi:hypothetical protein
MPNGSLKCSIEILIQIDFGRMINVERKLKN